MNNKNISIYVFTGTGNTLTVADKISDVLNKNNCTCNIVRMESVKPENIDLSKTVGIGFTVAFWNTYPSVRKWINALPDGKGTEAFLFTTMGDSSMWMVSHIAKILEKKNYKIIGSKGFVMPNNFLLVQGEPSNTKKTDKALKKVEVFAESLAAGNAYITKRNILSSLSFMLTNFVVMHLWNTKFAKMLMRIKVNKDKCTKCGLCSEICPQQNIELKNYPVFSDKCIFCLRCIAYCPSKSLSSKLLYKNRTHKAVSAEEIKWKKQ